MKNLNIIKARIKRNKLDELAGELYRDDTSSIIKGFNSENKKALLGIESNDGKYTILGEEYTYYRTSDGNEGEISHFDFLKILKENAMSVGKTGDFEFININEKDIIWIINSQVMNALWNTILLVHSDDGSLE